MSTNLPVALLVSLAACGGPAPEDPPPEQVDEGGPEDPAPDTLPPRDTHQPEDPVPPAPAQPPLAVGRGLVDVSAPLWAAGQHRVFPGDRPQSLQPRLAGGTFADLDGDGRPEVVVSGVIGPDGVDRPRALRFDPSTETLTEDDALSARLRTLGPDVLWLGDADGDGDLDALSSHPDAPIRWGNPRGGFGPAPAQTPNAAPEIPGITWADIDRDGWLDLVRPLGCVSQDPAEVWVRQGLSALLPRPGMLPSAGRGAPYFVGYWPHALRDATPGAAPGAVGGLVLAMSTGCQHDPNFQGSWQATDLDAEGLPRFVEADPFPYATEWRLSPVVNGGYLSQMQPMGAATADLDRDGVLDLWMSTGWMRPLVYGGAAELPLPELTDAFRVDDYPLAVFDAPMGTTRPQITWGIAPLDFDLDGHLDALIAGGNDAAFLFDPSPVRFPQMLYRGRVDAPHPDEIAALVGLTEPSDARGLAIGDLDLDGRPDVILGGNGQLPRVYLNRLGGDRTPVALRLRATTSPMDGLGAEVRAYDRLEDDLPAVTTTPAAVYAPGALSAPEVFLTGPSGQPIPRVTLSWPSGVTQELRDVGPGWVEVTEPTLWTVDPPDRRLPADGVATATLHVTPRATDGSLAPHAAVEVWVTHGQATIGAPVAVIDGWEVSITAPTTAGSARLAIAIDGVEGPLHPRVWFDAP